MTAHSILKTYVDNGLLSKRSMGNLDLYCYTADCFFGKNTWDDVTKTHRGALYQRGIPVNHPFPKIFNLGEVPECESEVINERMRTERYEVMDKANGHLLIVSVFPDHEHEREICVTTKGSFPGPGNDLLNTDVDRFYHTLRPNIEDFMDVSGNEYATFMFEVISDHDPHTMYEQQASLYGENTLVLLGVYTRKGENDSWVSRFPAFLNVTADWLDVGRVKSYYPQPTDIPKKWLDHTGIEGYVIWFYESDFRVKIKTKEYWALRFKNDLSAERIVRMFRAGGHDRIHLKLPEEVASDILAVLEKEYEHWYHTEVVDGESLLRHFKLDGSTDGVCRIIMRDPILTEEQKKFLVNKKKGREVRIFQSKKLRKAFFSDFEEKPHIRDSVQAALERIVDNI